VRLFDITADPGMKHDLSAAHADLCARAKAEFHKPNPEGGQPL